jgi:hypothetical protein
VTATATRSRRESHRSCRSRPCVRATPGRHVKAALALTGFDVGDLPPPCAPLGAAEYDQLRAVLEPRELVA